MSSHCHDRLFTASQPNAFLVSSYLYYDSHSQAFWGQPIFWWHAFTPCPSYFCYSAALSNSPHMFSFVLTASRFSLQETRENCWKTQRFPSVSAAFLSLKPFYTATFTFSISPQRQQNLLSCQRCTCLQLPRPPPIPLPLVISYPPTPTFFNGYPCPTLDWQLPLSLLSYITPLLGGHITNCV